MRWRHVQEFPAYAIDREGVVVHRRLHRPLFGSRTPNGGLEVSLSLPGTGPNRNRNRNLQMLVDKAFNDPTNTEEVLFRWILVVEDNHLVPDKHELAQYLHVSAAGIDHAFAQRRKQIARRTIAWVWSPVFREDEVAEIPKPLRRGNLYSQILQGV